MRNAVIRQGAKVPVKLTADDFDVYRTELITQSATAILVDVSRSMLFRGCFLAAKKVTLALDSLIRSSAEGDYTRRLLRLRTTNRPTCRV